MVQLNFDANQVAPNTGFEPVPEGWYNVAITESEIKPTKDGEGAYLQLKASIIDGPHANKPVFIRLNIQNKNQQAVDIAYGELSAICHVTGVYQIGDSSQLHGIPFQVRVACRKTDQGETNDVKAYRDAAGNEPGKAKSSAGGQPQNFGGQPQGQPQGQPGGGWQGQPQGGQAPQGGGGWQGQPGPAQGQAPAQNGPQGGNWGQPGQGQPQGNPNQGQPPQNGPAQGQGGGAPWGGGQPAQGAQQPPQGQGNAGWTQQPAQGGGQGGAPWGAQGGQQ